jgi:hypothetical protein
MSPRRPPTKKRSPRKVAPAARKSRQASSPPDAGAGKTTPISLSEARSLVAATQPRRAVRRATGSEPQPGSVGAAREDLEQAQRDERAEREREYTQMMRLMKARGAKRAPATADGRRRAPAARAFKPLQAFAEGDSWFDYPRIFGGGVIPRLEKSLGVPILNLAKAGDETRFMLGVEQRRILIDKLTRGCPAGGPWDVLLFSGGGNDIVDNPMALWILDWNPARRPADHIHPTRFGIALEMVRAAYEDLIALRDQLSPNTRIVLHGYDHAIPDGRGVCHYGPWLEPTFALRGFPPGAARFEVVKEMLTRFAAMLQTLARPGVSVVDTQGTLSPVKESWHNELHPSKKGFNAISDKFQQHLKRLFPDRVI